MKKIIFWFLCLFAGIASAAYLEKTDVTIRDGINLDAFQRLRISSPFTIYDSKQLTTKDTNLYISELTNASGTAVFNQSKAATILSVTSGGKSTRATRQKWNYQSAKGQLIPLTWRSDFVTGITTRVGYFSSDYTNVSTGLDGLYFEFDDGTSYVVRANNGTVTKVAQADWNIDKLNGEGPSGETVTNWNAAFIGLIQFQWLGVGRATFGLDLRGLIVPVHQFIHSPDTTNVYMKSPNQRVSYHIESDGGGAGSLDQICAAVISEGGFEQNGLVFSRTVTNSFQIATATDRAMLWAIRLNTNFSTTTVVLESIIQAAPSLGVSEMYEWQLVFNPDNVAGLAWEDVAGSSVQFASAPNIISTNASAIVDSGFVSSAERQADTTPLTSLRLGTSLTGVPDVFMLRVISRGANGDDIRSGAVWRELQ